MKILVLNTNILAVDPKDAGTAWETADQIIPKHVAEGAKLVTVPGLPDDYAPGRYTYDQGFVLVQQEAPAPAPAEANADVLAKIAAMEAALADLRAQIV